jgi:subtilase family serine protease
MRKEIRHLKYSAFVGVGLSFFATCLSAQEGAREEIRADETPRFEVLSIDATPEQPAPGEQTTVAVEVANGGDVLAQSVSLTLRVGQVVIARRIIELAPHSSQRVDFFWTPDRLGNHALEAAIDEEAQFPEIERADNLLALPVVVAQRAPKEADFAVTNLEVVEIDEQRVIRATVKNNGTVASSTPLTLRIGRQLLRSELIDTLRPRETKTIEFAVPSALVLERFQVELNPRNRFAERDASDNLFISDLRPDVDIAVEDLRILSNRQGQS